MVLKRVEAWNFKSFRELRLDLGRLNVLIGANGAGKSNVLSLLRFVRDAAAFGLENAVSLQGGLSFLSNVSLRGTGTSCRLRIMLAVDSDPLQPLWSTSSAAFRVKATDVTYSLALQNEDSVGGIVVAEDAAEIGFTVHSRDMARSVGRGVLVYRKEQGQVIHTVSLPANVKEQDVFQSVLVPFRFGDRYRHVHSSKGTFLEEGVPFPSEFGLDLPAELLSEMAVYDLNVRLLKQAIAVNAKADLEEDGSNLAIVLRRILANDDQRQMLTSLVHYVLPFIAGVETEQFADRFLLLKLRESYGNEALPASLLSDGTIYVVALIVALYFSRRSVIAIEEPEKHFHPYLLARVAELLKDAAQNTQVIVTTQNPELVRHVDLRSLLLVTRDQEGFSTIRQPAKSEEVQHFLHNEIGIAELFTQNLLGI